MQRYVQEVIVFWMFQNDGCDIEVFLDSGSMTQNTVILSPNTKINKLIINK